MPKLGVNIDHIATLRQQRDLSPLDLILAAKVCESSGADSIVVHLREDRRHIQDRDVKALRLAVRTRLNLEMACSDEIVRLACLYKPDQATLVPEKRQELTTEGGLNVVKLKSKVAKAVAVLKNKKIEVSLFIEPDLKQIKAAFDIGAGVIEIHTGAYANSRSLGKIKTNLQKIKDAAAYADKLGIVVNSGHGLDYENVCAVAGIRKMNELNIGYSIICYAVFAGLDKAVAKMKQLIEC